MILISNTEPQSVAAPGVPAAGRAERPAVPAPAASPRPVRDEFVPEEKRESYGRYWLERDEEGSPRIRFDAPEAEDAPAPVEEAPEADRRDEPPEKPAPSEEGRKAERCICSTDKVDREIKKLRKEKEALERQLSSEPDEMKAKELARKLAQR